MTENLKAIKNRRTVRRGNITKLKRQLNELGEKDVRDISYTQLSGLRTQLEKDIQIHADLQTRYEDCVMGEDNSDTQAVSTEEVRSGAEHQVEYEDILRTADNLLSKHQVYRVGARIQNSYEEWVESANPEARTFLKECKEYITDIKEFLNKAEDHDGEVIEEYKASLSSLTKKIHGMVHSVKESAPARRESTVSYADARRKLEVELPQFNGDPRTWVHYHELFKLTMEKRGKDLSSVERCCILITSLQLQEDKDIVQLNSAEEDGYSKALELLMEKYGQTKVILPKLIKRFKEPKLFDFEKSSLREIGKHHITSFESAERMGVNLSQFWTAYIVAQFNKRLADEWVRFTRTLSDPPNMKDLKGWTNSLTCSMLDDDDCFSESSKLQGNSTFSYSSSANSKAKVNSQVKTENKPKQSKCYLCNESPHSLARCQVFKDHTSDKRWKVVKEGRYCTNCLHHSHTHQHCPSTFTCKFCNGRHHSMLHRGEAATTSPTTPVQSMVQPVHKASKAKTSKDAEVIAPPVHNFLNTAVVLAVNGGRSRHSRLALDPGSGTSVITEALASQLKLKRHSQRVALEGAYSGGTSKHFVEVTLHNTADHQRKITLKLSVISKLPWSTPPRRAFDIASDPDLQSLPLADGEFGGRLDMLLSSLDVCKCLEGEIKFFPEKNFVATPTIFGWTVAGPLDENQTTKVFNIQASPDQLSDSLQRLWELEQVPESIYQTPAEEDALQQFEDGKSTDSSGRYMVSLPKIKPIPELGKSKPMALSRFFQNERSLKKKGKLTSFSDSLLEYEQLGHAEIVPASDMDKPAYYLPVHGVFKSQSTTTKVRPVFDASAKSDNGISLNDLLLPGPNLYPLLTDILIQFRRHRIGFSADISKMFREIRLTEEEKDLHRFLMRNEEGVLRDYRMRRLTFGVKSSPFLATKVLHDLAEKHSSTHQIASHAILNHFYVDDFLSGADDPQEADTIRKELCGLLSLAGMTLRKWRSSCPEFTEKIPEQLRETEVLTVSETPKALGIHWDVKSDCFNVATPETPSSPKVTKRLIASLAAQVYDVLGLFAPFVVRSKLLLQQLWKCGIDWDEEAPEAIKCLWNDWIRELPMIHNHPVHRRYNDKKSKPTHQSLHGFSDASTLAYGAVIYIREQYPDGSITTSLVISKARVAPIKNITIPRAEVVAAHLLTKLLSYTRRILKIPPSQVHAWTDSTIVLCWLRKPPSTLQTFVSNRIGFIQSSLPEVPWKHVPTHDNPADLLSRGVSASTLTDSSLWWKGPEWLRKSPDQWTPQDHLVKALPKSLPEQKVAILSINIESTPNSEDHDLWTRYSSFHKLVKVRAWMQRFIHNSRSSTVKISSKKLSSEEIKISKAILLKISQEESFPNISKLIKASKAVPKGHPLQGLNLAIDSTGLVTATGRVRQSQTRLPKVVTVLSLNSSITKLLISTMHRQMQHPGIAALMAIINEDYYIPRLRSYLKTVSRNCATCQKAYARTSTPPTGSLPIDRTTPTPPFTVTGLDFAGPVIIRQGHTRRPVHVKAYICLFVCFATKAIHLEVCSDLSTEAFLAAFKRFCARRGTPVHVHSDNGKNFVGAAAALKETQELVKNSEEDISTYCQANDITWHFSPPRSPNFGGLWEAGVKQMKTLLRKQISHQVLKYEELNTVLAEVEAILNSRPMTPIDSTEVDDLVLTPGHFLIGRPLKAPARPCSQTTTVNMRKRWTLVQRLQQELWLEWQGWYKQTLMRRTKEKDNSRTFKIGDIILLKDEAFTSTRQWPIAKITELYPGTDGIVRAADILCKGKIYRRGTRRFILLIGKEDPTEH